MSTLTIPLILVVIGNVAQSRDGINITTGTSLRFPDNTVVWETGCGRAGLRCGGTVRVKVEYKGSRMPLDVSVSEIHQTDRIWRNCNAVDPCS